MLTKHEGKALAMLSIAIIELAFMPIAFDIGGSSLDTVSYLFLTFLTGSAVSFMLVLFMHKIGKLKEILKERRLFAKIAAIGLLNYVFAFLLLTYGTVNTSASFGGVMYRMWVLLSILFIPLVLKVKVNIYQIASLLVAFAALYIAMTNGTLLSINAKELPFIIMLIFAAASAALSNVMMKTTSADLASEIFIFNSVSLAFVLLLLPFVHIDLSLSIPSISAVLFAGAINCTIGAFLFFYALRGLDVTIVGNATLLIPFLTFLFSYILLGEPVYWYYLVLAALIIFGMFLQRLSPVKAPERLRSPVPVPIFDVTSALANSKNPAIYKYMAASNKVLAVKGSICDEFEKLSELEKEALSNRYSCLVFTSAKPHSAISNDELEFMKSMLNANANNGNALIGIGKPDDLEKLFVHLHGRANAYENLTKTEKQPYKF